MWLKFFKYRIFERTNLQELIHLKTMLFQDSDGLVQEQLMTVSDCEMFPSSGLTTVALFMQRVKREFLMIG